MSKSVWIIIAVVIVAVVGGGAFALVHNSKSSNNTTSQSSTSSMDQMSTSTQTNTTANPVATDKVVIANFAFSPATITVKKGTTVTWSNQDSTAHTITETDGKTGPNSGSIDSGKSYSFTYNTAGTYNYHCSIHTSMTGLVVVTE